MSESQLKSKAVKIAQTLADQGHQAYFAGGCVRDALRGVSPKDYDLATSARPEEIQKLFPKTDSIGAHFGVILVKEGREAIEVATFRKDGDYKDNRRPESVLFTTAKEDAKRRDFTINGLFQHPQTNEIYDFVGGQKDLENKLIRAIGEPERRFQEDALRLLRAIRFSVRTGFKIEPRTWEAIKTSAHLLKNISPERIRDEFSQILTTPNRAKGLDLLLQSGLLVQFLPEALKMVNCEQPPEWHPEGDVYTHTKIALKLLEQDAPLELCLAVLLHDIGKPPTEKYDEAAKRVRFNNHDKVGADMSQEILRRLRYPNNLIEDVSEMVLNHMKFMHVQQMRTAKLKRFISRPTFQQELELHRVDCQSSHGMLDNLDFLSKKQDEFANELLIPPPLLTGHDILSLGIPPGPKVGQLLHQIQTEQLEGHLTTKEEALEMLQTLTQNPPEAP